MFIQLFILNKCAHVSLSDLPENSGLKWDQLKNTTGPTADTADASASPGGIGSATGETLDTGGMYGTGGPPSAILKYSLDHLIIML